MCATYNAEERTYYFECPHCMGMCQVPRELVRCRIFRHAVSRVTLQYMDPHATEEACAGWVERGEIYGCGRPFTFDGRTARTCGYI
jgi:hypothetical protein